MSIIFSYPYPKDIYFSDLQEKLDFYYNIGLLNHKFKTAISKQYSTSKDFNHSKFWQWCRYMSGKGHEVFVSEYNAPDGFE